MRQLSTLIASPDQKNQCGKKRGAINTFVPRTQDKTEQHRDGKRKSAPHVTGHQFSFIASAPCQKPAKKYRHKGTDEREDQNKFRRLSYMVPATNQACWFCCWNAQAWFVGRTI